jgi:hypothetical protein
MIMCCQPWRYDLENTIKADNRILKEDKAREDGLISVLSRAILLTGVLCLMVTMTGTRYVLPFSFGLPAIYVLLSMTRLKNKKAFYVLAGVSGAAIVVASVMMAGDVLDRMRLMLNNLYEASEKTQAYIYERYTVTRDPGDYMNCMKTAVLMTGLAAGFVFSLFPQKLGRWLSIGAGIFCMIAFAYFGLLPQVVPAAVMMAGLVMTAGTDRLGTLIPVVVAAALIFAMIVLIAPGENKTISRADEQVRDRLATSTVALEGSDQSRQQEEKEKDKKKESNNNNGADGSSTTKNGKIWIVLGLVLLTGMILFIPAVIHDRLEKKRKRNRMGLASQDNARAICAMFPYSVKWLKVRGLEDGNVTFAGMTGSVREITGEEYAGRYVKMLELWKEAAYSDHEMQTGDRQEMESFMKETMEMVKSELSFSQKADVRFKYAL